MENNSILDNDLTQGFRLNSKSKNNLLRVAQWAKFLAISLFVSSFWMIYKFVQMTIATQYARSRNHLEFGELVTVMTSIAMIVFTFFAAYNLLSFANRVKLGLNKNNNKIFAISIESLKSYFKFYGLFTMIIAVFTFLTFITLYLQLNSARGF